ncbi:efflux RND transporter periplasmic adaptor subunit [Govanella unica]|uniref:Efflux RND transporter periplasmic adaptor subunit n=1 Tax=Govanella unica TaxID=2975056 RepID=A0A9X3Z7N1_9PROT|nr:efflux RND transporter periplasmic adaptor subunit [Govania unica]MDA5194415.1 efflux RND transporter periplasmic adaptor subunit [Govania unica]
MKTAVSKKFLMAGVPLAALFVIIVFYLFDGGDKQDLDQEAEKISADQNSVTISDLQKKTIKLMPVGMRDFVPQSSAVGYIDFNQDKTVQVFTPWAGRIKEIHVKAGDEVKNGQPLYIIDSPDLGQAEANLIATEGALQMTAKALSRVQKMMEGQAAAQKDLDEAINEHQTAEANYKAARDAVRIFGRSNADIDKILATRQVSGDLIIKSPLSGRVTARNAAPGLLAQPGDQPAPVAVADLSSIWMVANVSESDLPRLKLGQPVSVAVTALPGRSFPGVLNYIAAAVDPATHRITVHSEIPDPHHELRPQMLANFVIDTGDIKHSPAVPDNSVVWETTGAMTVFVTRDGRKFERRAVKLGLKQAGFYQIVEGLSEGEQIASDGALFLSNAISLKSQ